MKCASTFIRKLNRAGGAYLKEGSYLGMHSTIFLE